MRYLDAAQRQSGASRLELLVAGAVVAVLAIALLERLSFYQEYAEKAAMDLTIASMRAGLRSQVASLLIADRVSEIQTLADRSPVSWLTRPPENYLGELDAPPEEEPRGKWYFDRKRRELVYTANNRRHFTPSVYRDYTVRVRPMRVRAPQQAAGSGAERGPEWVVLVVVNDYQWF
jgi:general secretion pathway protein G